MKALTSLLITLFLHTRVKAEVIKSCDSPIYCHGELLHTVQMAKIYQDSKTFVDMNQKHASNTTLDNFNKLMKETNNEPSREQIHKFVEDNFESSGELVEWVPSDFTKTPKFLNKISNTKMKEFAKSLIEIWPMLARKVNDSVAQHPDRHSLISLPNGFIIPGGRFKEIYYWDSYWIVKGLLLSDMSDTVRGILENFASLIKRFGFIPNGSRVYYLNRSQPPMFALMVGLYLDATDDNDFVKENVETVRDELEWWVTNRKVRVSKGDKEYDMFRYYVNDDSPRPESYYEDLHTCGKLPEEEKRNCYINLKSGAESGWDYSTRWLFTEDRNPSTNLSMIDIIHVIPVDLNAILCKGFKELSRFYMLNGDVVNSNIYNEKYKQLRKAIKDVLYNEKEGIWFDYDLTTNKQRKAFYPSNFAPLWADAYNPDHKGKYGHKAAHYYKANNLERYLGGIPTSLINSGQQWDLPNAWPPLQDYIILGLKKTGVRKAKQIAKIQAERTLKAYMQGWQQTKEMFEKYDALTPGGYGGGGEYTVQAGFGWTNGEALHFIKEFYTDKSRKPSRAHGK